MSEKLFIEEIRELIAMGVSPDIAASTVATSRAGTMALQLIAMGVSPDIAASTVTVATSRASTTALLRFRGNCCSFLFKNKFHICKSSVKVSQRLMISKFLLVFISSPYLHDKLAMHICLCICLGYEYIHSISIKWWTLCIAFLAAAKLAADSSGGFVIQEGEY